MLIKDSHHKSQHEGVCVARTYCVNGGVVTFTKGKCSLATILKGLIILPLSLCFIIKFWRDHRICINNPEQWPTVISAPAVSLIPLDWLLTTSFPIPHDRYPPSQLVGITLQATIAMLYWEQTSENKSLTQTLCPTSCFGIVILGCHTTTVGWDLQPWGEKISGFTTLPLTRAQDFCLVVGMRGWSRMLEWEKLRAGSSGTWDGQQHLWCDYPCAWGSKQSIEDQTTTPKTKRTQIKRWNKNCHESAKEKRFKRESIATSEVTLNHATHLFLSRVSPFFLWWEKPHSKSLPLQAEFWAPGLFTVPPYWQFFRLWCCFSNLITKTGSSIMALEMHLCHVFKFLDR